jgi:hypothetical protein
VEKHEHIIEDSLLQRIYIAAIQFSVHQFQCLHYRIKKQHENKFQFAVVYANSERLQ